MELFSPVSEALNHTESFSYMFSEEEPTSGFRQWMESLSADSREWELEGYRLERFMEIIQNNCNAWR